MAKTICLIQYTKKEQMQKKNDGKNGKVLYKLMNNAVRGKAMEKCSRDTQKQF